MVHSRKYTKKHRHSKKCKHSKKGGTMKKGGKKHHKHSMNCKHSMRGGVENDYEIVDNEGIYGTPEYYDYQNKMKKSMNPGASSSGEASAASASMAASAPYGATSAYRWRDDPNNPFSNKTANPLGGKHYKRKHYKKMRGGNEMLTLSPAPFSLGGPSSPPSSNFIFDAAKYGSNVVPTSSTPTPPTTAMTGGRRTKKYRGGSTSVYGFLPPGSGLSAPDSGLANVAPYIAYKDEGIMVGGKKKRHYKGGLGYGALAPGSTVITAKNSGMANYAPYVVYKGGKGDSVLCYGVDSSTGLRHALNVNENGSLRIDRKDLYDLAESSEEDVDEEEKE
jgi:hypothetical protein